MIVLDTNTISEVLTPTPSDIVLQWLNAQLPHEVFITVITQAELLYGVESLPEGKRKLNLAAAIERVFAERFPRRILPFDEGFGSSFRNDCKSAGLNWPPDIAIRCHDRCDRPLAKRRSRHAQHSRFRRLRNSGD